MASAKPLESRSGAQTLERGLDLIERVVDRPMTLNELAEQAGLGPSTTRRLVASLTSNGFLALGSNRLYRPGPKLFELGMRGRGSVNLIEIAQAPMRALSTATGITSFLGERLADDSIHLHRTAGTQRVSVSTPVGTRRRLAETSLGRALLLDDSPEEWQRLFAEAPAELRPEGWDYVMREAVALGYVHHDSPSSDRIRAIAAPVRDATGCIVAAISIVSPMQYADAGTFAEKAPLLCATAAAISGALGYRVTA